MTFIYENYLTSILCFNRAKQEHCEERIKKGDFCFFMQKSPKNSFYYEKIFLMREHQRYCHYGHAGEQAV